MLIADQRFCLHHGGVHTRPGVGRDQAAVSWVAPRVTVSPLLELHHLLIECGFRRSSRDNHTIVQGEQYAETASVPPSSMVPSQLSMALDSVRLQGMSPFERRTVLARLARQLVEAAGVVAGNCDDDEH